MILRFPLRAKAIFPSPVPNFTRPNLKHPDRFRWLFLLVAAVVLFVGVSTFHIPGKGFSALLTFGERHSARYLAEVDRKTVFIMPESDGYDSQWYAQLAVEPNLKDPRLDPAIDNLPYRARRVLFCWTAWALGLGQPRWTLEAFALQNLLCWLLLGALLLRWLPPHNWDNVARWTAVMLSFGLVFSIRGALVDGPGLLLIACGVALAEKGRPWLAALLLGLTGLGKETCILSGVALAQPPTNTVRDWAKVALRGLLVVAPLALWTAYLIHLFGHGGTNTGSENFNLPFVDFWRKIRTIVADWREGTHDPAYLAGDIFTVVSLAAQFLFFALRPRWRETWWRIGAVYALLMMCLGHSVWDGYPSAAARVLLPMLLAFNLAVPRGRRWWIVLLLGNLTFFSTPNFLSQPVGIEPPIVEGPASLCGNQDEAANLTVELAGPWYRAERSMRDNWRWTHGTVEIVVRNPHPDAVAATLAFGLNSRTPRAVQVSMAGAERWSGTVVERRQEVVLDDLRLAPGETRIRLATDRPSEVFTDSPDRRSLAFRVLDLKLRVRRPAQP